MSELVVFMYLTRGVLSELATFFAASQQVSISSPSGVAIKVHEGSLTSPNGTSIVSTNDFPFSVISVLYDAGEFDVTTWSNLSVGDIQLTTQGTDHQSVQTEIPVSMGQSVTSTPGSTATSAFNTSDYLTPASTCCGFSLPDETGSALTTNCHSAVEAAQPMQSVYEGQSVTTFTIPTPSHPSKSSPSVFVFWGQSDPPVTMSLGSSLSSSESTNPKGGESATTDISEDSCGGRLFSSTIVESIAFAGYMLLVCGFLCRIVSSLLNFRLEEHTLMFYLVEWFSGTDHAKAMANPPKSQTHCEPLLARIKDGKLEGTIIADGKA